MSGVSWSLSASIHLVMTTFSKHAGPYRAHHILPPQSILATHLVALPLLSVSSAPSKTFEAKLEMYAEPAMSSVMKSLSAMLAFVCKSQWIQERGTEGHRGRTVRIERACPGEASVTWREKQYINKVALKPIVHRMKGRHAVIPPRC